VGLEDESRKICLLLDHKLPGEEFFYTSLLSDKNHSLSFERSF